MVEFWAMTLRALEVSCLQCCISRWRFSKLSARCFGVRSLDPHRSTEDRRTEKSCKEFPDYRNAIWLSVGMWPENRMIRSSSLDDGHLSSRLPAHPVRESRDHPTKSTEWRGRTYQLARLPFSRKIFRCPSLILLIRAGKN